MSSRLSLKPLAAAALLLVAAASAQAVALNNAFTSEPFLDTPLGGTTFAARPELGGTVVADDLAPFSFNGVTGTVQNRVVRETGTGTLDFYWRVMVDASSQGGVQAFRLANFGYSFMTDADWRIDGLGSPAPLVGRLFNPATHPEGAINFLFTDPAVGPDTSSRFFFLHTSATSFGKTAMYDMLCAPNDCVSGSFATYAPAVPEPSTTLLAALGLGALGVLRRRRTQP
jgi:hypothetical protein